MKNTKNVASPATQIKGEMAVKLFGRFKYQRESSIPLVDSKGRTYVKCLGTFVHDGTEYVASYNSYGYGHIESGLVTGQVYPIILTSRQYDGKTYYNYEIDNEALLAKFN